MGEKRGVAILVILCAVLSVGLSAVAYAVASTLGAATASTVEAAEAAAALPWNPLAFLGCLGGAMVAFAVTLSSALRAVEDR